MIRVLFLLLFALPSWGAVESHFVRSEADCAANGCGTENGSSYPNAWRKQSDVSYSAVDGTSTAVDPGDILYFCSPLFTTEDVDTATVMINPSADVSGTAGERTTFDGDCSAYGGPTMAKFDGGGTHDRGFDVGSTQRTYLTLKNFELANFDAYGIIEQGLATASAYWIIDNLYIHDIRGANARGIWSKSADMTLLNTRIHNTSEDNLYLEGDRFVMIGNELREGGLDQDGDNVQFGVTEAEDFIITDNSFQTSQDIKQCLLIGTDALPTSGVVARNVCIGPSATAANHTAFFIRGTGTVTAAQNYAKNSRYLIYAAAGLTLNAYGNVGHDLSSYGIQCGTGATDCRLFNNSVNNAPVCFSTESASGTSIIQNNVGIGCTTSGIRKNAGDTETNNAISDSADFVQNETTTTTPGTGAVTVDPQFLGGANPTTAEGFQLKKTSPLRGAGVCVIDDGCVYDDFGGNGLKWDIGAIRRDACYRRGPSGAISPARRAQELVMRCGGSPAYYPEGLE